MDRSRETPIEKVRVIGVFAHIDAGKTTTSEAILYYTGRIHRIGSVDEGSTQLDWMEQERRRGITITAAATTCDWQDHAIHLIDTPGHIDFTAEVVRSIRVIDGAVIVMCGVGGVETQTETVWRHADRQHLARLVFVNKLDRNGADFGRVLDEIHRRLTPHAVALQWPIYAKKDSNSEEAFVGVVDLLEQRALIGEGEGDKGAGVQGSAGAASGNEAVALGSGVAISGSGTDFVRLASSELGGAIEARRNALLDAICETDEALLEQRLEGGEPDLAAYQAALRRATIQGELVPVLCGSAKNRIGVQPLLDAIVAYLPSPEEGDREIGGRGTGDRANSASSGQSGPQAQPLSLNPYPLVVMAFKIVSDPHVGHLTWVRVFSGQLKTNELVYNPRTGASERVDRIYRIHANRRELVNSMQTGDVMALVGLKSAITGDTLCQPEAPIELETFTFPEPVISVALEPSGGEEHRSEERDRLRKVIERLCEEDPTLAAGFDAETGEDTFSGMGELHLEIAVDRMRTEYGLLARASLPQVAYRETIRQTARATGDYRKQSGGHGHFAVVRLRVQPLERGSGIVLDSTAPAFEVPENLVRAAQAGIREALGKGILAGYPVTDLRVTVQGGKFHDVDSNSMDFHIAGSMGVRQALRLAQPALLEPVMRADIHVDTPYLGTVTADFARRRGDISEIALHGERQHQVLHTILGEAPLAELRGYATDLRDMTSGRGTFTLELCRYAIVPDKLAEAIVEERLAKGKVTKR